MFKFENQLNKVKLVQSELNIVLVLKLARYESIIHLLCDSSQFNLLMINDICFTLCSVFSNNFPIMFTGDNVYN